ncbi:YktB family protein [Sporosarcina sp. UB5]|uniref:YktB family protein n=1 Tax=Sporosarcina sp. UB5 TaxID=3047463 RepID=UPI003D7A73B3
MTRSFWTTDDFEVFSIAGLEKRMNALQTKIQPKFEVIGEHVSMYLSARGTGEFFPHVAKHARRTVNPPNDSWVAFAPAKRGYKALPHFQIGLWGTHLFIILAVIYDNPDKKGIAERLSDDVQVITSLPNDFVISGDHMKPEAFKVDEIGANGVEKLLNRLHSVKKAEFIIGLHVPAERATELSEEAFFLLTEEMIDRLFPIYDVIIGK